MGGRLLWSLCPLLKHSLGTGLRTTTAVDQQALFLDIFTRRLCNNDCYYRLSSTVSTATNELDVEVKPVEKQVIKNNETQIKKLSRFDTPKVGVIFDIDGVLVRGRKVIPGAAEAINVLESCHVPIIYLTNGGCETEEQRAEYLQKQIGVKIDPAQVVLSHSPLRILDILHHKHVVVSGQGPVSEIAEMCGFSKVSHVDDIDQHFPELDVNDRNKRDKMPTPPEKPFYPVEAILLMGEPVNWEKSLQIIIDILLSKGDPSKRHQHFDGAHIPIVAINTDFLFMSEAANPRIGHGGFLLCLESMYQKLTGRRLEYTAILGKPNLFTYRYTEGVMYNLVSKMYGSGSNTKTIYGVGDNPDTDIYGANLYNNYLKAVQGTDITTDAIHPNSRARPLRMKSILVKTGVYGVEEGVFDNVNHLHRDTICRPDFSVPTHVCDDVLHAVNTIMKEEEFV